MVVVANTKKSKLYNQSLKFRTAMVRGGNDELTGNNSTLFFNKSPAKTAFTVVLIIKNIIKKSNCLVI